MNSYQHTPEGKDPQLWQLAKRRSSFKGHFATYVIIIASFWAIWFFSGGNSYSGLPWPVWPTFGWGIGIAFHYIGAYASPKYDATEKEYEKLIQQKNKGI